VLLDVGADTVDADADADADVDVREAALAFVVVVVVGAAGAVVVALVVSVGGTAPMVVVVVVIIVVVVVVGRVVMVTDGKRAVTLQCVLCNHGTIDDAKIVGKVSHTEILQRAGLEAHLAPQAF
jgi:hypothetical protein